MAAGFRSEGVEIVNTSSRGAIAEHVGFRPLSDMLGKSGERVIKIREGSVDLGNLNVPEVIVDEIQLEKSRRIVELAISKMSEFDLSKGVDPAVSHALETARLMSKGAPGLSLLLQEKLSKVDERLAVASNPESQTSALCEFLTTVENGITKYRDSFVV
jgi:hypothetical protein